MEKRENTSNKQEKRKMAISIGRGGGGGVGGVVLCGGALAIATLVSVSAIKFRRRRSSNKSHPPPPPPVPTDLSNNLEMKNSKDEGIHGLRALLQDSSPPIHYQPSSDGTTKMGVTQIDSTSLVFTESLILDDDNPVLDISGRDENSTYGDHEILFSDNSKPESSPLLIDHGVSVQEYSLPVLFDSPSLLKPEKVNKNGSTEHPLAVEVIEVMKEDRTIEAPQADQIAVEENLQMQLIEDQQQEEESGDGENIVGKGEEAVDKAQADQIAVIENPQMKLIEEQGEEYDGRESTVRKGEEEVETAQADHIAVVDDPQMQSIEEQGDEYDGGESMVRKGEEADETAQADQITIEDDPPMQLSEVDTEENSVDDDDNEEDIVEKGEESSEGTGDSSMESNAEAIWPAESIQELSLELKELKINNQKLEEKPEEDRSVKSDEYSCRNSVESDNTSVDGHHNNEDIGQSMTTLIKRDPQELWTLINQPTNSSSLRIWMWSLLVLLLVLLLVVVPLLLSLTQIVKLCLIFFFIVILSMSQMFDKLP